MKVVHLICAARPNFMKVAPLYHALKKTDWCKPEVISGGQHKDFGMYGVFWRDLLYAAGECLDVGPGTHAEQTARAMLAYEKICAASRPDAIVVPGDVNTSMACALVGAKLGIPVVHLEAGLRSFDRSMPEEINRIVIDSVSDLLLTPSDDATKNLLKEGRGRGIVEVGNIMIDTFEMLRPQIEAVPRREGSYAVVTLHRPSNVDSSANLAEIMEQVEHVATHAMPVIFPVHPRTRKTLEKWKAAIVPANLHLVPPTPYVEFMALVKGATIVITDSGGVQEETSYLGVPCATVRENTERPVTISHGTNELIQPSYITTAAHIALKGAWKKGGQIPLWDGKTAGRCVESLQRFLC